MKTKLRLNFKSCVLSIWLFTLLFSACKKDARPVSQQVHSSNSSGIATDGTVTVQPGILPPATPQSFIPNGGAATVLYEFTTTRRMFIFSLIFSATPDIYSITSNLGDAYNAGYINLGPTQTFEAGESFVMNGQIHYNNVDSTTSGTISKLTLTTVHYQTTDDDYIHTIETKKLAVGPTFCLVNNIPHIQFRDPKPDTIKKNYVEITELKLSGDTAWTLNALPLYFSAANSAMPKSDLIVRYRGVTLKTKSDSMVFNGSHIAQSVIHFAGGFKHTPGTTEVLKVYRYIDQQYFTSIVTELLPLSAFVWTDGLGKQIGGTLNAKYYKEQSGSSIWPN